MNSESKKGYSIWMSPSEKELIERGAKISALSTSGFIRSSAIKEAREILREAEK